MITRTITKALAGKEDLLLGQGSVDQTRDSAVIGITKFNSTHLPYSGDAVTSNPVSVKDKIDLIHNAVTSLASDIAAVGSDPTTFIIEDSQVVSDDLTIPVNVTLDIRQSGSISVASSKTVNINKRIYLKLQRTNLTNTN